MHKIRRHNCVGPGPCHRCPCSLRRRLSRYDCCERLSVEHANICRRSLSYFVVLAIQHQYLSRSHPCFHPAHDQASQGLVMANAAENTHQTFAIHRQTSQTHFQVSSDVFEELVLPIYVTANDHDVVIAVAIKVLKNCSPADLLRSQHPDASLYRCESKTRSTPLSIQSAEFIGEVCDE